MEGGKANISVLPCFFKRSDGHKLNKPWGLVFWESLSISQFSEMSLACKLNIGIQSLAEKISSSETFMPITTRFHFLGLSGAPTTKVQYLPKHSSIPWGRRWFSESQERANHVFELQICSFHFLFCSDTLLCQEYFLNYISKHSFIHYLKLHKLPKDTIFSSLRMQYTLSPFILGCTIYLYNENRGWHSFCMATSAFDPWGFFTLLLEQERTF